MGKPSYLSANKITAIDYAATHDAVYTRANLFDGKAAKPFRTSGLSNTITLTITTSAGTCDAIGIIAHNIPAGAGITLTPSGGAAVTITRSAGSIWKKFSGSTATSWALTITNSGMTSVQIGEIILGTSTTLSTSFSYGWTEGLEYANDSITLEMGTTLPYERFHVQTYNLPFNAVTLAQRDELEALYRAVKGSITPIVFAIDAEGTTCIYGRIINAFGATNSTYGIYSSVLQIRGESEGVIIT